MNSQNKRHQTEYKPHFITMGNQKNWHEKHKESLSFGSHLADSVAKGMGSWRFIIIQTILVVLWMGLNLVGFVYHWDVYPFILLNLVFSTQAAYAAPIIMMSQNRQNDRDRVQAQADYQTNIDAKIEIEALAKKLNSMEVDKLDKIIKLLEERKG
jgi:uncharacterized membrane protein